MKSLVTYLISGLIGGLVVLGGGYLISDRQNEQASFDRSKKTLSQASYKKDFVHNSESVKGFSLAADRALPSVVLIKAIQTKVSYQNQSYSEYNPFSRFFNDFMTPQPREGSGSGVIISEEGYIVTNNHVIEYADDYVVTLNDGREFKGVLIGTNTESDLAVLKIDAEDLVPIRKGSSESSKVGEWVLAIGNPFGLTNTVTAGIISAKGRDIGLQRSGEGIEAFIQTDAAVNAGNSGGALINLDGELIGINTAIFTRNGGYVGYSFAIPVEIMGSAVEDIIKTGMKGYLGITIANMDKEIKDALNLDISKGVYVYSLVRGGSAQYSGILPNDVIVKINGAEVQNVDDLERILEYNKAGDRVELTINRYGKEKNIPVVLKAG